MFSNSESIRGTPRISWRCLGAGRIATFSYLILSQDSIRVTSEAWIANIPLSLPTLH